MERYDWKKLNSLQVGRYAEYLVKMEFTLHGFDVYAAEVDDKGIDFILRKEDDEEGQEEPEYRYYDVQVKSTRGMNYIFFTKDKFKPRDNLFAALVLFQDGEPPMMYLIPSTVWRNPEPPFVGNDYERLASKPEWGLNLSRRNLPALEPYYFSRTVAGL